MGNCGDFDSLFYLRDGNYSEDVTAMRENDYCYWPNICPVCGFFSTLGEFLKREDKYHVRLVCPQCGARTDFVESIDEAIDAWLDGDVEVEEVGDGDA